jgi:hypothetical protein
VGLIESPVLESIHDLHLAYGNISVDGRTPTHSTNVQLACPHMSVATEIALVCNFKPCNQMRPQDNRQKPLPARLNPADAPFSASNRSQDRLGRFQFQVKQQIHAYRKNLRPHCRAKTIYVPVVSPDPTGASRQVRGPGGHTGEGIPEGEHVCVRDEHRRWNNSQRSPAAEL